MEARQARLSASSATATHPMATTVAATEMVIVRRMPYTCQASVFIRRKAGHFPNEDRCRPVFGRDIFERSIVRAEQVEVDLTARLRCAKHLKLWNELSSFAIP